MKQVYNFYPKHISFKSIVKIVKEYVLISFVQHSISQFPSSTYSYINQILFIKYKIAYVLLKLKQYLVLFREKKEYNFHFNRYYSLCNILFTIADKYKIKLYNTTRQKFYFKFGCMPDSYKYVQYQNEIMSCFYQFGDIWVNIFFMIFIKCIQINSYYCILFLIKLKIN